MKTASSIPADQTRQLASMLSRIADPIERAVIVRNEFLTPIRLVGGDLYLMREAVQAPAGSVHDPFNRNNYGRFQTDVGLFLRDMEALAGTGALDRSGIDPSRAIELMHSFRALSLGGFDLREGRTDFLDRLTTAYDKLADVTVLADNPNAARLGIRLLQFDTEYTGIPRLVLPKVMECQHSLVSPGKGEGFRRAIPLHEWSEALASKQAQIFVATRNHIISGFYEKIPHGPSVRSTLQKVHQELVERGVVQPHEHCQWATNIGSTQHDRLELHRKGLNINELMDRAVMESALWQNCDQLLMYVAEGNTSRRAHERLGWRYTGYSFPSPNNPELMLHALSRRVRAPASEHTDVNPDLGRAYRPRYRPPAEIDDHEAALLFAPPITCAEAVAATETFLKGERGYWDHKVQGVEGDCYYLWVTLGKTTYTLYQLRPGTDAWRLFGEGARGNLETMLGAIMESAFPRPKCDWYD